VIDLINKITIINNIIITLKIHFHYYYNF